MDINLVNAIAQLLTGIATLIVATFLSAQLVIQKKQLEIAHIDSNRNLAWVSRTQTQKLTLGQITRESFLRAYENATYGFDELNDTNTLRFFGM